MNKKIFFALILLLTVQVTVAQNTRTFPYTLDLQTKKKHKDIIEAAGSTVDDKRYTNEGLYLTTTNQKPEKYAFALDKIPFDATYGINVEFEYAIFGGKRDVGRYGDGMSFFLYDTSKSFEVGSYGAGLGYTYRETTSNFTDYRYAGLNGAYLGVGLDVFGGFHQQHTYGNEKREGIPDGVLSQNGERSIVIRGGANEGKDRFKGYPVLYAKIQNQDEPFSNKSTTWAKLDDNGDYITGYHKEVDNFDIRADDKNAIFQKVKVTLIPDNGDMLISIKVDHGTGVKAKTTTIVENLLYESSFKTRDQNGSKYSFKTKIPKSFKVGFAGATGGSTEKHLIKNVVITLPYGPEIPDVLMEPLCYLPSGNTNREVSVDPFENAKFYTGSLKKPTSGNSATYINFGSFRFEDAKGSPVGTNYSYTQVGVGVWTYDPNTHKVTVKITNDNLKKGDYTVYFSAKGQGTPFGTENYRSGATPITLRVEGECDYTILVNPRISIPVSK